MLFRLKVSILYFTELHPYATIQWKLDCFRWPWHKPTPLFFQKFSCEISFERFLFVCIPCKFLPLLFLFFSCILLFYGHIFDEKKVTKKHGNYLKTITLSYTLSDLSVCVDNIIMLNVYRKQGRDFTEIPQQSVWCYSITLQGRKRQEKCSAEFPSVNNHSFYRKRIQFLNSWE